MKLTTSFHVGAEVKNLWSFFTSAFIHPRPVVFNLGYVEDILHQSKQNTRNV
jgi:hypothetical protein